MSDLYDLYLSSGNEAFSRLLEKIVPYFATIEPMFVELRPNYAEVTMPNTPKVHNHLGTVHAIAMCNLAEIAAGLMTDVSIPADCRWIPVGMNVRYLAKATTDLRATADGSGLSWLAGEVEVPVRISDSNGLIVCSAQITVKIGTKKTEGESPDTATS